ncbi:MAG: ABC transporter permease [Bacteroidota bacterium]|jgi:ABC-2 type transport system permease protein
MNGFRSALWAETLKLFRSKVLLFTVIGFSLIPLAGGLFLIILKDPEGAKSMGLVTTKAQITVGVADWPAFMNLLLQAVSAGGIVLFSILPIWIFGREFAEHTVKELLSLPTSRQVIVSAKFFVVAVWAIALTLYMLGLGLVVGYLVVIPGFSSELLRTAFTDLLAGAFMILALLPFVAFFASLGRGYLLPFGWVFLTMFLAQIVARLGWGDWFPWSVPALYGGMAGPRSELLGIHSYIVVLLTGILGLAATFYWWRNADQTR